MKFILILVFSWGSSVSTVNIPMKDLTSCVKARDGVPIEAPGAGYARVSRAFCVSEDGDVFEKGKQ